MQLANTFYTGGHPHTHMHRHKHTHTRTHTHTNQVQARYNAVAPNSGAFGGFDPQIAWDDTVNNPDNPQPPVAVINPLMSSMQCYRNYTSYFPNNFEVRGLIGCWSTVT